MALGTKESQLVNGVDVRNTESQNQQDFVSDK